MDLSRVKGEYFSLLRVRHNIYQAPLRVKQHSGYCERIVKQNKNKNRNTFRALTCPVLFFHLFSMDLNNLLSGTKLSPVTLKSKSNKMRHCVQDIEPASSY